MLILENSTDGIILLDATFTIQYISISVAAILGFSPSHVLNTRMILHPEDYKILIQQLEICINMPGVPLSNLTLRFRDSNDDSVWVDLSISNFLDEPQVGSIVLTVRDVSSTKKTERQLVHANRLYAFISQINQATVRMKDQQSLFEEVCRIAVEYGKFKMAWIGVPDLKSRTLRLVASAGTTDEELELFENYRYDEGGPIEQVVEGLDYCVVDEMKKENSNAWYRIAATRKYSSAMVLAIKKAGALIATFNIYSPEAGFFNKHEVRLLIEANTDLCYALEVFEKERLRTLAEHNREKAEQELKQIIHRYELVSRATSDALWDWDVINDSFYVAEGFETLFGYKGPDIGTRQSLWTNRIHPDDREKALESLEAAVVSKDSIWKAEYRFLKQNGEYAYVRDRGFAIRNESGRAIRMVGAMRDISERIKAAAKLEELNRDLSAYTNELVSTNSGLQQFSYIISHNLRSPVANIMALTTYLRDETNTPETNQELYNALDKSVELLNGVIVDLNTILTVKNEVSDKKEQIKLSSLLFDIQLSIQNLIDQSQAKIMIDFTEADELHSLKSYLHSIFINLISNSIKYAQPGVIPLITIKSERNVRGILIRFKDNGMGIDLEKKRDQVFGLYKRFHENIKGKGMGLFMVKTQVETLGGEITVESEVNKGAEFSIILPR